MMKQEKDKPGNFWILENPLHLVQPRQFEVWLGPQGA